jgi:hypothetical protein
MAALGVLPSRHWHIHVRQETGNGKRETGSRKQEAGKSPIAEQADFVHEPVESSIHGSQAI